MKHEHADVGPCLFVVVNGVQIHIGGEGHGPAIILVHGSQAWYYTWRHQIESLANAGYRVVAPDLPGSGYSDLTEVDTSIKGLSRFLGDLLDALGSEQAAFVASSAGGLPVLDFAIRHPERVSALVLASTCGVPHREPLHRSGAWAAQVWLERNWQPGWVATHSEQISEPALVVWGENDPYHPLMMAGQFGRRTSGSQVEILPQCGHLPHEERPNDFNRLLLEFF